MTLDTAALAAVLRDAAGSWEKAAEDFDMVAAGNRLAGLAEAVAGYLDSGELRGA